MKWEILFLMLIASISLQAQKNSVSGIVVDAETKLPVPFAHVFFANTTMGVNSDQEGRFRLSGFPSGKYDLLVTFVGYANFQESLEFDGSNLNISINLTLAPIVLHEVVVREDTTDRARNLEIFKRYFLGETTNAKKCRILNPEIIHLFFDTNAKVLVAHAKEPIEIENMALGFRIRYYLYTFEFDFDTGRLTSFGVPSFQELEATSQSKANRWNKERLRAYYGSMNHFMRAFRSDQLKQEGFEVRRVYQVTNRDRPPQHIIDLKIKEFMIKSANSTDSLRFYRKLNSLPVNVDSLAKTALQANELLTADTHIRYKGRLSVMYKKELEENGYLRAMGRTFQWPQKSVIHFLSDSLRIYSNGYYEDQKSVFIENYWAWSEKISDYLPNNYQPIKKSKKK
jgi:hypothetical protein